MRHRGFGTATAALLLSLALIASALPARAAAPEVKFPVTFTTTLTPGTVYPFSFSIWDARTGGTQVAGWAEGPVKLPVASNKTVYFVLGSKVPLPALDFTQQYWVEIATGLKKYRTRLPAAGYAQWSESVNTDPLDARYVQAGEAGAVTGGMIADGQVTATKVGSETAAGGQVLAADGAGGASWQALAGLPPAAHQHAGEDVASGTVGADRVDAAIARDAEIVPAVLAADGAGSGLDADLLDGQHGAAFAASEHAHGTAYYTKAEVDALVAGLQSQVAALQSLLQHFSRNGNDVSITGANLWIKSGSGATNGTVNGFGNLIVGYNEGRAAGGDLRTGSHNLVLGRENNFSNYGGLIAGLGGTISGAYAVVSGGHYNVASGQYASVSGGYSNTAAGAYSSVSGGEENTAAGAWATVSGGGSNHAGGQHASISGGGYSTAGGTYASVSGGDSNTASGTFASVSGGYYNSSSGDSASISGGGNNTASGNYAVVTGGGGPSAADGNIAFGHFTAILGGGRNKAGDRDLADHSIGRNATVGGGANNRSFGNYASVAGGGDASDATLGNRAVGEYSVVVGGVANIAGDVADFNPDYSMGKYSAILGGAVNNTRGWRSTISGGDTNQALGHQSAIAGGYGNATIAWGSTVGGGRVNYTYGNTSSVSGGWLNKAYGDNSSVSGGYLKSNYDIEGWTGGAYHTP